MGHPDGAHTHGSSSDWRAVAAVAVIVAVAAGGGASGLISGLTDLLIWVASILTVAAIAGTAIVIRAMRHSRGTTYIRGIHGPTARERELDKMAELRREIALTKAARWQLEVAQRMNGDFGRFGDVIEAEVIESGPRGTS